jgi:hypothetical protein
VAEVAGHHWVPGRCASGGRAFRGGMVVPRLAAYTLTQEERGPVKRLAGLVDYAGE